MNGKVSKLYERCELCPRRCGVNRSAGVNEGGWCGETDECRVAHVGPHFGEEPPITGTRGSGTVFFSGCSLRCGFCQNHQISHRGMGRPVTAGQLGAAVREMIRSDRVHNVNFVTPDHFFPHVFRTVGTLRSIGVPLPMVYNLSGYQSVEMVRRAEGYADIYLVDYKYADSALSGRLSRCFDYPRVVLEALSEMVKQKGFLEPGSCAEHPARKGVLVRHLILPGCVDNSLDVLTSLFVEFGESVPVSLMSQYRPVLPQRDAALNGVLPPDEFERVYRHALELGFEHLYVQFPERSSPGGDRKTAFLPDFRKSLPFA